ncbi:PREDICTED: U-box domain-containing protein 35-like [Lupinus angustifolius]|uniref:U-box domain-containing protein 35-like n=1 Tax=Lupinus angustifolius TaxID=3871 RepID=UPI00092E8374|nr:PREDICTED: U-box domain-containing protein 35-like [Lupinus angustifolius]
MLKMNSAVKIGSGRTVAVAIENNKTSQYAAKWAVDNLVTKDQSLFLIHVRTKLSDSKSYFNQDGPKPDKESKDLFDSFRIFFNRKSVQCKELLLEDTDICKALIESMHTYSIELMVLGAPSRSGIVRRFRTSDVPSNVTKVAPPFCTIYIISKGKVSSVKTSTAPLLSAKTTPSPAPTPTTIHNGYQFHPQLASQSVGDRIIDSQSMRNYPPPLALTEKPSYGTRHVPDEDDFISPFTRAGRSYESSLAPDSDISFVSNGRPSVDRLFPSLHDDMDGGRLSYTSDFDVRSSFGSAMSGGGLKSIDMCSPMPMREFPFTSQSNTTVSSLRLSNPTDEVEAEMRRLKLELKQTMEMYSTACKEALTANQKAMELQRWKMEEQKKLEEARIAEEAALGLVEMEKEKCRAALKAAEQSQRIAELEGQKRLNAEMKAQTERKKGGDSFAPGSARYRRYTIEEIEEATKCFSDTLKIGEGGYGPVYRTELDHTPVAIKVLKPDAVQGRAQFQQEVEVLSCIRHPNMVLLLGACPEYGCLVYEYMANGSLDDCLFRRGKSPPLPWQLRFQIAAEIATGLLFLHQTKPEPLVHRDLKPGNILLDRNYVSKISDVGLARLVPPSVADTVTQYRMTSTAGTFCYIDPEYQQTGMLGIKSDIYSLGIMLLQLVTAKPPMGLTHHVARSIEKGTFGEMLDPAIDDWPLEQALHFAKLCLQCAEMRRKDRPDLGKVVLPEINKLRAFAEENMPVFMYGGSTGFAPRTSNASMYSSSTHQNESHQSQSQSLSGMSGYESRSSTSSSSQGRM